MDDLSTKDKLQTPINQEKTLEYLLKIHLRDEQMKRAELIIEENDTLAEIYQQMCRFAKDIKDESPPKTGRFEKEPFRYDQEAFSDNPETEKTINKLHRDIKALDSLHGDLGLEIEGLKKQINKSISQIGEARDYLKTLDDKVLVRVQQLDALEAHLGKRK